MDSNSTSNPDLKTFYEFTEPTCYKSFRATLELNENARKITRGELDPSQPVIARWFMGGDKPEDIIWTDSGTPVLLSDRMLDLFLTEGFTGWSTYDVKLFSKNHKTIPGYSGLVVKGRCGPIDDSLSRKVAKKFPARISTVWKGLYFDPSTWDGSDFFMPEGNNGWIIIVEKVKRALEKFRFKNAVCISLDEVERHIL